MKKTWVTFGLATVTALALVVPFHSSAYASTSTATPENSPSSIDSQNIDLNFDLVLQKGNSVVKSSTFPSYKDLVSATADLTLRSDERIVLSYEGYDVVKKKWVPVNVNIYDYSYNSDISLAPDPDADGGRGAVQFRFVLAGFNIQQTSHQKISVHYFAS